MGPDFLSRLSPSHRALLEQIGRREQLEPRFHLLRRGDPGGDVFRVEAGTLDVIDTRSRPEVILDVVGTGELVGEMSFVDGSPRSADVVAGKGCIVTRWPKEDLDALLSTNPHFSAHFWRALAQAVADRLREVNANLVIDRSNPRETTEAGGDAPGSQTARELARNARDGLAAADRNLRRAPESQAVLDELYLVLGDLLKGMVDLSTECGNRSELARSSAIIAREIQPYLLQSTTAGICLSRPDGHAGGPRIVSHLLKNRATGDGPLGQAIDSWLLNLPLARAIRAREKTLGAAIQHPLRALPPPVHAILINVGGGRLANKVHDILRDREGTLMVVEPGRETIRRLASELSDEQHSDKSKLWLQYVQDNLVELAQGRSLRHFKNQDFIIVDSLLEYLPARVATRCLQNLGSLLKPGGQLFATALGASPDAPFWEHLLDWTTIRRAPGLMKAIVTAAGYRSISFPQTRSAGMVILAGSPTAPESLE